MQRRYWHRAPALAATLLVIVCAQTPAAGAEADPSLSVADYIAAGVPDPRQPWSADEMAAAAKALDRIAAADPEQLPVRGSARSGEVFSRIISAENTAVCRLPSAPGNAAGLTPCIRLGRALDVIVKSYAQAGPDELALVFGADLQAIAALIRLSDQYKLSIGEDPESVLALVSAEGARRSAPRLAADGLAVLREPGRFASGVVESYLGALRDALPVLLVAMDPAERDRLLPLLPAMAEDPGKRDFRASFEQLAADVDAALRAAPADAPRNRVVLHRGGVCTEDPRGGCLARSTGGGFSVWLPVAFDDLSVDGPIQGAHGSSTRALHMLGAPGRIAYQAVKLELAGTPPDAAELDPVWRARGFTVERSTVQSPRGTFDEARLVSDAETLIVRSRRVGSAVYRLTARYRADVPAAEVQPSIKRFFASLDVAGPAAKTVKKEPAKKSRGKKTARKKR